MKLRATLSTICILALFPVLGKEISSTCVPDRSAPSLVHGSRPPIRGTVTDVFPDDIDSRYVYLTIDDGHKTIYAPTLLGTTEISECRKLVGASIEFSPCITLDPGKPGSSIRSRLFAGHLPVIQDIRDVKVTRPSANDPFDVPEIGSLLGTSPSEIGMLGRRRLSGRVIAVWNRRLLLVDTVSNSVVRVELAADNPPAWDSTVELSGYVGTDIFRLNLNCALWRPVAGSPVPEEEPATLSIEALNRDSLGRRQIRFRAHGKPVRIRGFVRDPPSSDEGCESFMLDDKGLSLSVNISSCPQALQMLKSGAEVEATGICVADIEGWRPNNVFPSIRSVFLVVRNAEDIRIIANPPWLTPLRMLMIILTLVFLIAAILAWNRSLRLLADRRGRALLKRELENSWAQLAVFERTRLAVELHDSVAQMLTGVSMELEAATLALPSDAQGLTRHLGIATRALDSCREELRNCLWDLRNDALDEKTMDGAIRKTLLPHCRDLTPAVRFNVPRSAFSDNTTHVILCIIRELVLNAIRHGKASNIRIAGAREDNVIRFSVLDNGSGFDPDAVAGITDGHFGLQGIRERIHRLGGTFSFSSSPGQGTKATVSLHLPQHECKANDK